MIPTRLKKASMFPISVADFIAVAKLIEGNLCMVKDHCFQWRNRENDGWSMLPLTWTEHRLSIVEGISQDIIEKCVNLFAS